MNRVALAVMRCQPLHLAHCKIIHRMMMECETAIIGLGSAQESKTFKNPWTVDQRITMIRNVYGERVKIVPLTDLGFNIEKQEWCDYVLEKLEKVGLPDPTDYYSGSEADASWYNKHFWPGQPTQYDARIYATAEGLTKLLHIEDRQTNIIPPATELRQLLQVNDYAWQRWVPAINHRLVATTFPDELLVKDKRK